MKRTELHTGNGCQTSATIKGDGVDVLRFALNIAYGERTESTHYIIKNNELSLNSFYAQPELGYVQLPFKINKSNVFEFVYNWYKQQEQDKLPLDGGYMGDGSDGPGFIAEIKEFGGPHITIKAMRLYYGK
jgi:hypothetical protein